LTENREPSLGRNDSIRFESAGHFVLTAEGAPDVMRRTYSMYRGSKILMRTWNPLGNWMPPGCSRISQYLCDRKLLQGSGLVCLNTAQDFSESVLGWTEAVKSSDRPARKRLPCAVCCPGKRIFSTRWHQSQVQLCQYYSTV